MEEEEKPERPAWKYALYAFLLVLIVGFALAMRHDDHMEERGQAVGQLAFYATLFTYLLVKLFRWVRKKTK
jgi:hypothetical protein